MNKVRVLVANQPRLMRELVLATISDQPDIEVMGEIGDDEALMAMVMQCKPDFVIIALDESGQRPLICDELLGEHPKMKVLALAPDRNNSVFFWSVPNICATRIENSEEGILSALRTKRQLVA
jgi:DNA-binding NarL/FixJ family response regulator